MQIFWLLQAKNYKMDFKNVIGLQKEQTNKFK